MDILDRRLCATGQGAHLGRDHGEPTPLFARARGLARGVQREQISLLRNAPDDVEHRPGLSLSSWLHTLKGCQGEATHQVEPNGNHIS